MRNVSELIKARLLVLLRGMPKVVGAYRDRVDIEPINKETQKAQLPAAFLLTGTNKSVTTATKPNGFAQNPQPPSPFVMAPEIWVALMPRDNAANKGVAEELSLWEQRVISAICFDEQLQLLCGDDGQIEYHGYVTDMQSGGEAVGQIRFEFTFMYMLDVADLRTTT